MKIKTAINNKFHKLKPTENDFHFSFEKGFANTSYYAKKKCYLVAEYIFTRTSYKGEITIEVLADENAETVRIVLDKSDFNKLPIANVYNIKDVVNQMFRNYEKF